MTLPNTRVIIKISSIVCQVTLIFNATMIGSLALPLAAQAGNSGAIWTTKNDCGTTSQDINHYATGDHIYINGSGFAANSYNWKIKGQPGGASSDPGLIVASGAKSVDSSGRFCFDAYTVLPDDRGEYDVNFGEKKDNYRVGAGCILAITKTAQETSVVAGSEIHYTLTLKNEGDANCTGGGVLLVDLFDPNLRYVSASSTVTPKITSTDATWNFGTVIPGKSHSVGLTMRVDAGAACPGTISNKAKYFSDQTSWSVPIVTQTPFACAPVCGDNIKNENEECDAGAENGVACTPEYGGTCSYCSSACTTINLTGPFCGDGNVQANEACEGTNTKACTTDSGYGGQQSCSQCQWSSCVQQESCGDNTVNNNEECDGTDQTPEHYTCSSQCTLVYVPYCGDSNKDTFEQCDGSAGTPDHYSCNSLCELEYIPYCGDNIKNGTDECDGTDGVGGHQTCSAECKIETLPYCGDNKINAEIEQCDDGNLISGDGCSSACTVEQSEPTTGNLMVCVYEDPDGDIASSTDQLVLSGWPVNLSTDLTGTTTESGCITFFGMAPADYQVNETLLSGWEVLAPAGGIATSTVVAGNTSTVNFINHRLPPYVPSADLKITKTVDKPSVTPGQLISYSISLVNLGPDIAYMVTATDTIPTGITVTGATTTGGVYENGVWSISELAVNATTTLTITATITGTVEGQIIANLVQVKAASPEKDPDVSNNTAAVNSTVHYPPSGGGGGGGSSSGGGGGSSSGGGSSYAPAIINTTPSLVAAPVIATATTAALPPILSLSKSVTKNTIYAGTKNIEYTLIAENTGKGSALNVKITDRLPTHLTFVDGKSVASWEVGELKAGEKKTIKYKVNSSIEAPKGDYKNTAELTASNHPTVKATAILKLKLPVVLGEKLPNTGFDMTELIFLLMGLSGLIISGRKLKYQPISI